MTAVDIEVVILAVVWVLPLIASVVLVRHWSSQSVSLHERTILALRDLLVATLAGAIAVNRILDLGWDGQLVIALLGIALILVSLPSGYWLLLYFRGAFR